MEVLNSKNKYSKGGGSPQHSSFSIEYSLFQGVHSAGSKKSSF